MLFNSLEFLIFFPVVTAIYFLLFAIIWRQYYTLASALWWVVWCATCLFSFVGAVAVHNSVHCPVFESQTLNRVFQVVLSLTYGHPVSNYVPGHNLSHHQVRKHLCILSFYLNAISR